MEHLRSYSVAKGRLPINWWDELDIMEQIVKKEFITTEDNIKLDELSSYAASWITCACGNQCEIIPRGNKRFYPFGAGAPNDDILADLGVDFYNHVLFQDVESARITLGKIEERSAYLIKEELIKRDGTTT